MRTAGAGLTFLVLLAAACESRPDAAAGGGDSAAPAVRADTAPLGAPVAVIEGLSVPESAMYDSAQDVWFISNISGGPGDKDGDGFIARVRGDGTVDSLRFIAGGRGGVTLHAPKGMALAGDTLWVADIDALRAFDRRSGAPLATIEFGTRATFLNDVARGPDGSLYVSDTGSDQVFRVAPDRSVTTAVRVDSLAPNGLAWDAAANRLLILSFEWPTIYAWAPGDSAPAPVAEAGGGNDGLELVDGRMLVTSWRDSALVAVANGEARALVRGFDGPADIGVDRRRGRVAVPVLLADRVEIYELAD